MENKGVYPSTETMKESKYLMQEDEFEEAQDMFLDDDEDEEYEDYNEDLDLEE